jgi:hypothetical protein
MAEFVVLPFYDLQFQANELGRELLWIHLDQFRTEFLRNEYRFC